MSKYDVEIKVEGAREAQAVATSIRQTAEIARLKMLYIGTVSLLCRVYVAGDVENDDAVERCAKDFNAQGYGLEMCKAGGRSGWGIFERRQERDPEKS